MKFKVVFNEHRREREEETFSTAEAAIAEARKHKPFHGCASDADQTGRHVVYRIENERGVAVFIVYDDGTENSISDAAVALGSRKSDKKAAASRENGKKGGRPLTVKRDS